MKSIGSADSAGLKAGNFRNETDLFFGKDIADHRITDFAFGDLGNRVSKKRGRRDNNFSCRNRIIFDRLVSNCHCEIAFRVFLCRGDSEIASPLSPASPVPRSRNDGKIKWQKIQPEKDPGRPSLPENRHANASLVSLRSLINQVAPDVRRALFFVL